MPLRLLLLLAAVASSPLVLAQSLHPTVWLEGGAAEFDLAGTGTARPVGVRSDLQVSRFAVVEAGLGFTRTGQTFSDVSYLTTDVEIQGQLPLGPVRPYLGLGLGSLLVVDETVRPLPESVRSVSPTESDGVLLLSLGARVAVAGPVHARLGVRLRSKIEGGPDLVTGAINEATLGVGYRF